MQDVTEKICTNTAEGFEKQLKDSRDGQLYWVGKMKDGRCWMLQNLALGKTTEDTQITIANSNISSDSWTLPQSYTTAKDGSKDKAAIQSWNFGKWVLATPLLTKSCGDSGISSLANCTSVGFVDVSSSNFQPTYTATTGAWDGANANSNTLVAVNCATWSGSGTSKICTAGTYDPHYLVGNYYSWNAATAGTGVELTSGEASDSICPKGWELPVGGSGDILWRGQATFAGLLADYGVSSKVSGTVDGITYNIAGAPLSFVRGGNITSTSYVDYAGQRCWYWTSTANASVSNYAYRLYVNAASVYPSYSNNYRYYGASVRCVTHWTYSGGTLIPIN